MKVSSNETNASCESCETSVSYGVNELRLVVASIGIVDSFFTQFQCRAPTDCRKINIRPTTKLLAMRLLRSGVEMMAFDINVIRQAEGLPSERVFDTNAFANFMIELHTKQPSEILSAAQAGE
jgi:hypothetical protein